MGASSIIILAIIAPTIMSLAALAILYHALVIIADLRGGERPKRKLFIHKAESTSTPSLVRDLKDTSEPSLAGPDGVTHFDKKDTAGFLDLDQVPKEDAMAALDQLTGRDKMMAEIAKYENEDDHAA